MTTIEEDYVSFETAKLLKEKGFDELCRSYWSDNHSLSFEHTKLFVSNDNKSVYLLRPTLQMAMKWLRESHNRHVSIEHSYILNKYKICITKYNPNNISDLNNTLYFSADYDFSTYEEACEAAIKYCLENLI